MMKCFGDSCSHKSFTTFAEETWEEGIFWDPKNYRAISVALGEDYLTGAVTLGGRTQQRATHDKSSEKKLRE